MRPHPSALSDCPRHDHSQLRQSAQACFRCIGRCQHQGRQRRQHCCAKSPAGWVQGAGLVRQSEISGDCRPPLLSLCCRVAACARSRRSRDTATDDPGPDRGTRRKRNARRTCHHRWYPWRAETGDAQCGPPIHPSRSRAELRWSHATPHRFECQFLVCAAGRRHRLALAVGSLDHRHRRLGARAQHRLFARRLARRYG